MPASKGRYQPFANGTIVWSQDEGAVLVPIDIFNYWIGLASQQAAEDPTRTRYDYIGLPKNGSDSPASTDTVAWDASVYFERGIIGRTGGQLRAVEGQIYAKYASNPAQYGLPSGAPPHTNVPNLQYTWIGQAFALGEIWTRSDATGLFTTFSLPFGAVFDYLAGTSDCGDPTADIASVTGGGEVGRFTKGNVFASSSAGATLVPNAPAASDGSRSRRPMTSWAVLRGGSAIRRASPASAPVGRPSATSPTACWRSTPTGRRGSSGR